MCCCNECSRELCIEQLYSMLPRFAEECNTAEYAMKIIDVLNSKY